MGLVDHALAELGGDERDPGLLDELEQHPAGQLAVADLLGRAEGADREHEPATRLSRPVFALGWVRAPMGQLGARVRLLVNGLAGW